LLFLSDFGANVKFMFRQKRIVAKHKARIDWLTSDQLALPRFPRLRTGR
jgi:hypothetical protein